MGRCPLKLVRCFASQSNKALHLALYNKYNLYLSLRYWNICISEAVVRSCSVKKMFLKILQNSQCFLWHRSFLWTLRHFKEHLFSQNTFSGCFWHLHESRFSILNTVYNKSAAEAWICLVSFYGGAKDFIFTCIFLKIITFFIKI